MEHAPKITCDVCPAVKGEVNHWFRYRRWVEPTRDGKEINSITFMPWDDPLAKTAEGHVCGQDCAAKMLIRHLDGKTSDGTFPESEKAGEAKTHRYSGDDSDRSLQAE
jgi:hypothetical protein